MEALFDSVTVRIVASLLAGSIFFIVYFGFDIYQLFTGRSFGYVNVYLIDFTRHLNKPEKDDYIVIERIGYRISLRDICQNIFLFWLIIYYSRKVTAENPVLRFGKWPKVLDPLGGRLSQIWAPMVLKAAGGWPCKKYPCQLSLVRDISKDSTNRVLRIVLVQDRDIGLCKEYVKEPPVNTRNFALFCKIVRAYEDRTGDFTDARVTIA